MPSIIKMKHQWKHLFGFCNEAEQKLKSSERTSECEKGLATKLIGLLCCIIQSIGARLQYAGDRTLRNYSSRGYAGINAMSSKLVEKEWMPAKIELFKKGLVFAWQVVGCAENRRKLFKRCLLALCRWPNANSVAATDLLVLAVGFWSLGFALWLACSLGIFVSRVVRPYGFCYNTGLLIKNFVQLIVMLIKILGRCGIFSGSWWLAGNLCS